MPDSLQHILVIEDEPKVAESLHQGLGEAGYCVDVAASGEEGLTLFMENTPDLLVLDLNLPGRDGIDILRTLRQHAPQLPVIILSARDDIDDRVTGLDTGADDYLVKPFAFTELLARIRALLRRDTSTARLEYQLADLHVDIINRNATRNGNNLKLTPKEFEILELLLRNQGRPVPRQTIARDIWNVQRATPLDNVIDVHIMRLRKKIDGDSQHKLIHTIRGLGFLITEDPETLP